MLMTNWTNWTKRKSLNQHIYIYISASPVAIISNRVCIRRVFHNNPRRLSVMAAFKVFIRRAGGVPVEVEVTPETTMQQINVRHDLIGYVLTFKGNRKGIDSVADLGI